MAKRKPNGQKLLDQLVAANEAGDKEKVAELTKELAAALAAQVAAKPPRKPRKPSKEPAGAKPSRRRAQPADAPSEPPGAQDELPAPLAPRIILPGGMAQAGPHVAMPEHEWMSRTQPTRIEARKVSMEGRKHINHFTEWMREEGKGADHLDPQTAKAEKTLAKNTKATPRPGQPGAKRPVAQKQLTYCGGCGRPFYVYPSEIFLLDRDSEWKCDRCIRRGR